jgi:hypothetical protein
VTDNAPTGKGHLAFVAASLSRHLSFCWLLLLWASERHLFTLNEMKGPGSDRELRHNGAPAPHCHPDRSGRLFPPHANASTGRVVEGPASPRAAGKVFPESPWLYGCSGAIEEGGRAFSTSSGQLENRNGCGLYLQPANIKVWALPGVGSTGCGLYLQPALELEPTKRKGASESPHPSTASKNGPPAHCFKSRHSAMIRERTWQRESEPVARRGNGSLRTRRIEVEGERTSE